MFSPLLIMKLFISSGTERGKEEQESNYMCHCQKDERTNFKLILTTFPLLGSANI